jgi:UDP-MurNAc hydroxylase
VNVRFIAAACVEIEHDGIRILCDPWLTEGIYYGSWFHDQPPALRPQDVDADWLYISHVHPDHFDVATLRDVPKSIPVLIGEFREKFLLRILQNLGFEQVIEVAHGDEFELAPGYRMAIFAADDCNPGVCGKYFGCAPLAPDGRAVHIDTLAVFTAGGQTIVNLNDCVEPMTHQAARRVRERYGPADLMLAGYSAAGSYPQCWDNYSIEQKQRRADIRCRQLLTWMARFAAVLEPRYLTPFAGRYMLGGRLAALNEYRSLPDFHDLPALCREYVPDTEAVILNPGDEFCLQTGDVDRRAMPAPPGWLDTTDAAYTYDEPPQISGSLLPVFSDAYARMLRYMDEFGYRSDWTFYFVAADAPEVYTVPFDGSGVQEKNPREPMVDPYLRIILPRRLMEMILTRKAHLNNADGGSHLRLYRSPDILVRAPYRFACYLQT